MAHFVDGVHSLSHRGSHVPTELVHSSEDGSAAYMPDFCKVNLALGVRMAIVFIQR